jgi:hypothetical protein
MASTKVGRLKRPGAAAEIGTCSVLNTSQHNHAEYVEGQTDSGCVNLAPSLYNFLIELKIGCGMEEIQYFSDNVISRVGEA